LPHCFEKKIGVLVYFILEIIIYLILKFSYIGCGMNSPNAQAYNHTSAVIIRI
jgi:hypothetical protein